MQNIEQTNQTEANTGQDYLGAITHETVHHNPSNIMPSASEIAYLWSSYLAETMSVCMLKYIVAKSENPDFKPIFQRALDISSKRLRSMADIFNFIKHPLPAGFGENDVETNAKELYSESFLITYTRLTNRYILHQYSQAYGISYLPQIRDLFYECISTCREIIQKSTDVLLAKGLLIKTPNIVIPDRVEYVYDKNYYGSLVGTKRPLNALEISYLFDNMESKLILETLSLGTSQTVKDEKVKKHLSRGKKITDKQVKVLGSLLEKEDLPVPTTSDFEITTSTESPFSDKLIMFHLTVVTAYSILGYGMSLTNTSRKDVAAAFGRLILELIHFAKDGTDLMIERGWLEKPPETADRGELIKLN
ncbi:MAG: hypothetical protein APF84_02205 [Gracilibacter sp. BRH_c7a]|nr:MAG: hypothetical protein APF84_02205 [Gracilibacter sp. BRH_c7a]